MAEWILNTCMISAPPLELLLRRALKEEREERKEDAGLVAEADPDDL